MRLPPLALALLFSLALAPRAAAQEEQTFTSVAGPWWFNLGGKDKGSVVLQFDEPDGGSFAVVDVELTAHPSFGFSRALGAFFQIAEGEELSFDANRQISGELALHAPDDESDTIGTLVVESGKVDKTFTHLNLTGTIECVKEDCAPVKVKLNGARPPDAFPVLSGKTIEGKLNGKGVKSRALDIAVTTDGTLGLPAYSFTAAGPVLIDGEETEVELAGSVMLNRKFKAQGLIEESLDFDAGLVNGKLRLPDPNSLVPKLGLTAEVDPKLKLKGQLVEPSEPILQVTPNGTVNLGAVRLGESLVRPFAVANAGTGELSGTAVLSGSLDFELTGATDYGPLENADPPEEVEVTFAPQIGGQATAQIRFGVDGGAGAQVVTVNAWGGVAEADVDPDPIAFGEQLVNTTETLDVTVTNTGDVALVGQASLSTSTQFALLNELGTPVALPIGYDIPPDGNITLTVRFAPTALGNPTATLTLTGVTNSTTGALTGTKTVSVTGSGTATTP